MRDAGPISPALELDEDGYSAYQAPARCLAGMEELASRGGARVPERAIEIVGIDVCPVVRGAHSRGDAPVDHQGRPSSSRGRGRRRSARRRDRSTSPGRLMTALRRVRRCGLAHGGHGRFGHDRAWGDGVDRDAMLAELTAKPRITASQRQLRGAVRAAVAVGGGRGLGDDECRPHWLRSASGRTPGDEQRAIEATDSTLCQ